MFPSFLFVPLLDYSFAPVSGASSSSSPPSTSQTHSKKRPTSPLTQHCSASFCSHIHLLNSQLSASSPGGSTRPSGCSTRPQARRPQHVSRLVDGFSVTTPPELESTPLPPLMVPPLSAVVLDASPSPAALPPPTILPPVPPAPALRVPLAMSPSALPASAPSVSALSFPTTPLPLLLATTLVAPTAALPLLPRTASPSPPEPFLQPLPPLQHLPPPPQLVPPPPPSSLPPPSSPPPPPPPPASNAPPLHGGRPSTASASSPVTRSATSSHHTASSFDSCFAGPCLAASTGRIAAFSAIPCSGDPAGSIPAASRRPSDLHEAIAHNPSSGPDESMPYAAHFTNGTAAPRRRHCRRYALACVVLEGGQERPVQLLRRHWIVTDGNEKTENIWGLGVIGEQPVILPNTGFEYSSACPLSTPGGRMSSWKLELNETFVFVRFSSSAGLAGSPTPTFLPFLHPVQL
ncbi:hypothetical protein KSP39_PZI006451 [Platanthera zijinensis]|uniref:ApaG domain-containing protein n=1 Tax=Platanthera zijinensis TaxID=2320716 RepID=A0AAP0BPW9_9ASPA